MRNRLFVLVLAAAAIAGCATSTIPTGVSGPEAERAVFAAKTTYSAMLTTAVAYRNLRSCAPAVAQPCSDPAIVAQLQKADNVASAALDAAEAAVRTPQIGTTARDRAVATANSALAALSALVSNLAMR